MIYPLTSTPTVSQITIYPIKSLDGISLQKGMIAAGGCLLHDRQFAIVDLNGKFINGKSNPMVHLLRSSIDFDTGIISFGHRQDTVWQRFSLEQEKESIDAYLTDFFKIEAQLIQNNEGQFMDIPDISGITILSTNSLQSVSQWYGNISIEETRKRFRATIEIEGVPDFWEDHLFSLPGKSIELVIGNVTVYGVSPRERCIVPTRHPDTGEGLHAFAKTFARNRAATLPHWSKLQDYGHYYYLSVDCYIPPTELGKWIQIGDEIKIIGEKTLDLT